MQSNKQSRSYECDYYVMQWMLTIVQVAINKDWDQVIPQNIKHFKIWGLLFMYKFKKIQNVQFLNDQHPLDSKTLEYVRTTWSKYFVTMYSTLG